MSELWEALDAAAAEYNEFYKPEIERQKAEKGEKMRREREISLQKLQQDFARASVGDGENGGDAADAAEAAEYRELMKAVHGVHGGKPGAAGGDGK